MPDRGPLRVVILGAVGGWHTGELARALTARGHSVRSLPYEELVARVGAAAPPFFEADAVLARIIPSGSLEQIIFRVNALHWIARRGTTVVNPGTTIERCVDKFYTTALLYEAGLPVPATVVCERAADAVAAVRDMGEAVIKPIFGSMGHGLCRVGDPDVAWRVTRTLEQMRAVFYVQQYVEHPGYDVRAFVVGGRLLAAVERHAPVGEWRTNVARGGVARPVTLPPAWECLAIQAAAAVDAVYAGVDLLPGPDGRPLVVEVNGIPGWKGLQGATGIDVAAAIVAEVETRVRGGAVRPPAAS